MTIQTISATDFTELLLTQPNLQVLDIRSQFEFDNMRLSYPTTHVEMHNVMANDTNINKDADLYILCKMGPRAHTIAQYLASNGFNKLIVIDGGIMGCKESSAPVVEQDPPANPQEIMLAVQSSFQKFMTREDID